MQQTPHSRSHGGLSVPHGALLSILLVLSLAPARPAEAQSFSDLVAATPPGESLLLPPGMTVGRADVSGDLTIQGSGSNLSAPADDAILVVLPGAELSVSGVILTQEGQSAYAVYVDGGSLSLSDCRIQGAFEVAIYVASGELVLRDCAIESGLYGIQAAPGASVTLESVTMTGQGDTAIRADEASLTLKDVSVTDGGQNGIIVIGAPAFLAEGLTVTGLLSVGLWVEATPLATLDRLVVQVSGQALSLIGGDETRIDGFLLEGTTGAARAETIRGSLTLSRGALQAGDGTATAILRDIDRLSVSDVKIIGGETGLYLAGPVPGASLTDLVVHSQTGTGLFLDMTENPDPVVMSRLRVAASDPALAVYFRDSGPVLVAESALIAAGPSVFAQEGRSEPLFRDSALIGAPEVPDRHLVFAETSGAPRTFLPDGPLGWAEAPAVLPGSRALTVAAFADSLAPDSGLRAPVLAFARGERPVPEDLMLALGYALPAATGPEDISDVAEIALAPPEPGWLWDPNAVRVTLTGHDGKTVTAAPGDFPLRLAAGNYALTLDGTPMGQVILGPDRPLVLPLPEAPFYAWRDSEGRKWRGPALYLRPRAELAALLSGFRPLRPGEYWGFAPLFAPRAGADRSAAAEIVVHARARLPLVLDRMSQLQADESWPAFNLRWLEADILLDILGAFGSAEDAAWLLSLTPPDGVHVDRIETAVLIEMRLGILADGAVMAAARAGLAGELPAEGPERDATIRLIRSVGRSGLVEGQMLLAELARRLQSGDAAEAPDRTGIVELSRLPPELAAGLPGRFLDQFADHVHAYLNGDLPTDAEEPIFVDDWNAAIAAQVHEIVYSGSGHPVRRFPVLPSAGIGESAWAFADPVTALGGPMGLIGPPDDYSLSGWTYRFPAYICAALAFRSPAERQATLSALRWTLTDAVTSWATPMESYNDPAIVAETRAQAEFAFDLILGECVLSDAVLNSFGRDAAGEEAAYFDNLDYEPLWWLRRPRSVQQLSAFAQGQDYPMLSGHSGLSLAEVEAALASGTAADPDLKSAFLARHGLLSDAFQASNDLLTFGAEHRQFRLRSEAGNGSITIAGFLDIRPVLSDGRLIVAIRHRIESPDYGGLAAMITEPDRAPFEADHRRLMFESVVLDKAGAETPMIHEGTSAGGVHFFAAPHTGDLSDLTLHVGMRFVDTTWQIDLPLWASTLAHDLRGSAGASEVSE